MAKIDSIVRISGGVLLNSPSVDCVKEVKISPAKVKRGDFFIDINSSNEEMQKAVENGAYCILTALLPKISDEEIAWISVGDLEKSLIKLARFFATQKSFRFVPLLDIHYGLAKSLHVEERVKLLCNSPSEALMQILKNDDETLFFVVENSFIKSVDPTVKDIVVKTEPTQIFESGIFHTSFVYKERFIKDIRLSSFFVPYLCALMDKLDDLEIKFRVESFNNFEHFYPQFVTSRFEKSDFGTTRKVIIFESDLELYEKELEYLYERVDKKLIVRDVAELQSREFRYALICGKKEDFEELIKEKKTVQLELF